MHRDLAEPLLPGAYYLNRNAYEVTLVDTRVKTWEYKGGFTRRIIDLSVDQQGNINRSSARREPVPKEAADRAVFVKVEGWDIPQELRVWPRSARERADSRRRGRRHPGDRGPHPDPRDPLDRAQCGGLELGCPPRATR